METLKKQMMEINRLSSEIDEIYHDIAQSYGLSDSVFWILEDLYHSDRPLSQTDLCNNWYYSKQTVNSAVASMAQKGWISLEAVPGTRNRKSLVLTESGRTLCARAVGAADEIEETAFSRFTEEERSLFISFFRDMNQYMRRELEIRRLKDTL